MMRPNRQIVPLRNFSPEEFICTCGRCGKSTDPELMVKVQAFIYILERQFNAPIRCFVTGPARCESKNLELYGKFSPSYHMGINRGLTHDTHGAAVDCVFQVFIRDAWADVSKHAAAQHAIESKLFGGVGWKIYGSESKFVHLDLGPVRTF